MAHAAKNQHIDDADLLGHAVLEAGAALGLNKQEVGEVIGKDRTSIGRSGISPDSKPGELALMLVRIYRSLFSLVGGDDTHMQQWMRSTNKGTGGVPREQIRDVAGLVRVLQYSDAMRGKL